jgi:hypothetical protein
MGKRSDFERVPRDFYPTPYEAVVPLIPHLGICDYVEPCAGDGALINWLMVHGLYVLSASDIEPRGELIDQMDVFDIESCEGDVFITNPPWSWPILDPLIDHLSTMAPTWLLLSADLMHNKRMARHMKRCATVVSVGRVKWIPDSDHSSKENAAWYLFDNVEHATVFYGREA